MDFFSLFYVLQTSTFLTCGCFLSPPSLLTPLVELRLVNQDDLFVGTSLSLSARMSDGLYL